MALNHHLPTSITDHQEHTMFAIIFRLLDFLAYRWKAVAAFLAPSVAILAFPLAQGGPPASEDWYQALAAALLSAFAVHQTGQKDMPGKNNNPDDTDTSSLEGDQADEPSADDLADLTEVPAGEQPDDELEGDHRAGKPIDD